jgi:hypothetical protein
MKSSEIMTGIGKEIQKCSLWNKSTYGGYNIDMLVLWPGPFVLNSLFS